MGNTISKGRLSELIDQHRRNAQAYRSKAREYRSNGNYDWAQKCDDQAESHENMAEYYLRVLNGE